MLTSSFWASQICCISVVTAVTPTEGTSSKYTVAAKRPNTITALEISAKVLITRALVDCLFRDMFLPFSRYPNMRSSIAPITTSGRESRIYLPQATSAEAILFIFFILLIQFVAPISEATSFLRSSYGHPQVQTVPSTTWVAPCPVVTPSPKGLARRFLLVHYRESIRGMSMPILAVDDGYLSEQTVQCLWSHPALA